MYAWTDKPSPRWKTVSKRLVGTSVMGTAAYGSIFSLSAAKSMSFGKNMNASKKSFFTVTEHPDNGITVRLFEWIFRQSAYCEKIAVVALPDCGDINPGEKPLSRILLDINQHVDDQKLKWLNDNMFFYIFRRKTLERTGDVTFFPLWVWKNLSFTN